MHKHVNQMDTPRMPQGKSGDGITPHGAPPSRRGEAVRIATALAVPTGFASLNALERFTCLTFPVRPRLVGWAVLDARRGPQTDRRNWAHGRAARPTLVPDAIGSNAWRRQRPSHLASALRTQIEATMLPRLHAASPQPESRSLFS